VSFQRLFPKMETKMAVEMATKMTSGITSGMNEPEKSWFIAIVGNRQEKSSSLLLKTCGYETYVAVQSELHEWSQKRRRMVDRVVITNVVFIHCTEKQRRDIFGDKRFELKDCVKYFLTNRAGQPDKYGNKPVAKVLDSDIARLRFMLENAENPVQFESADFRIGQQVRVIRGGLQGMDGLVEKCQDGSHKLVVRIESLGHAKVSIDAASLEPVSLPTS